MAMELQERINGHGSTESRDILFLMGGAAMVVFGAGLILSTPFVRGILGEVSLGNLVGSAVPKDLQRYLKLRAM